jgi:hypothetical protein
MKMEWRSSVDEEWKTKFKTKIVVFYSYSQPFLKISSLPAYGVFISQTVFATNSQARQKHMRWHPDWQTVGDVHATTAGGGLNRLVAVASPTACHAETLQPRPAVC